MCILRTDNHHSNNIECRRNFETSNHKGKEAFDVVEQRIVGEKHLKIVLHLPETGLENARTSFPVMDASRAVS